MHEWGFFGMGFWWIMPLLFFVVLFYFFSNISKHDKESASEILDKKYANGEISEEDYKRKKANLKQL